MIVRDWGRVDWLSKGTSYASDDVGSVEFLQTHNLVVGEYSWLLGAIVMFNFHRLNGSSHSDDLANLTL